MANERGTASQWTEPDPEAVAPAASLGYVVEDGDGYSISATGPGDASLIVDGDGMSIGTPGTARRIVILNSIHAQVL